MRILFYQWNAYNLYDIKETLSALGHEVVMLDKPIPHIEKDDTYTDCLADSLKKLLLTLFSQLIFSRCWQPPVMKVQRSMSAGIVTVLC